LRKYAVFDARRAIRRLGPQKFAPVL